MLRPADLRRFQTMNERNLAMTVQQRALELGMDARLITLSVVEYLMDLYIEANADSLSITDTPSGGRVILRRQSE